MEYLRNALLPRRLTEMYADTKRTYEQIVQNNIINPQISSLHLKLKIQKTVWLPGGWSGPTRMLIRTMTLMGLWIVQELAI